MCFNAETDNICSLDMLKISSFLPHLLANKKVSSNRRKLRLKQARDQQERKDLNHCFRPVSFVLFFQICSSFLMFNVSSPLPDHSIYVPGLIHKSPKDSLPGNLRGRYPSGHLLHFRWILPVTVKNPHKSCIFCTFMRVLYFCVIFTNSQLNYAFICSANFQNFPQ